MSGALAKIALNVFFLNVTTKPPLFGQTGTETFKKNPYVQKQPTHYHCSLTQSLAVDQQ